MSYRYEWTWDWKASRPSITDIPPAELLREIENKIKGKLGTDEHITGIESITHSNVQHWTDGLIMRRYSGTTRTVFLSTVPSASPIAAAIAAIIIMALGAVIMAIWAFTVSTVTSTVRELAAAGGGLGGLGWIVVAGIAAYAWLTRERKK